jgi:hypothetical protein
MSLTVSYNMPRAIAAVLRLQVAEALVQRTLLRDLQRFSTVLTGEWVCLPRDFRCVCVYRCVGVWVGCV